MHSFQLCRGMAWEEIRGFPKLGHGYGVSEELGSTMEVAGGGLRGAHVCRCTCGAQGRSGRLGDGGLSQVLPVLCGTAVGALHRDGNGGRPAVQGGWRALFRGNECFQTNIFYFLQFLFSRTEAITFAYVFFQVRHGSRKSLERLRQLMGFVVVFFIFCVFSCFSLRLFQIVPEQRPDCPCPYSELLPEGINHPRTPRHSSTSALGCVCALGKPQPAAKLLQVRAHPREPQGLLRVGFFFPIYALTFSLFLTSQEQKGPGNTLSPKGFWKVQIWL